MNNDDVVTRDEAALWLENKGYDAASAEAMVIEYLHDCSHRVGVAVYQWGLDGSDVDAIADAYAWVDHAHGETLDTARERAAGHAAGWAELVGTDDRSAALEAERELQLWAGRAIAPVPFTAAHAEAARWHADDPLERARNAVECVPHTDDDTAWSYAADEPTDMAGEAR